ncbi:MAG: hypothetical protein KGL39_34375 [Patescibacteria group bacterium]|nr:hypothetical protein [Patescibacteria group bacterium]
MNAQSLLERLAVRLAKDAEAFYHYNCFERAAENTRYVGDIRQVLLSLRSSISYSEAGVLPA